MPGSKVSEGLLVYITDKLPNDFPKRGFGLLISDRICFFDIGVCCGVKINMVIPRINVHRLPPPGIVELLNLNYFSNGELAT